MSDYSRICYIPVTLAPDALLAGCDRAPTHLLVETYYRKRSFHIESGMRVSVDLVRIEYEDGVRTTIGYPLNGRNMLFLALARFSRKTCVAASMSAQVQLEGKTGPVYEFVKRAAADWSCVLPDTIELLESHQLREVA